MSAKHLRRFLVSVLAFSPVLVFSQQSLTTDLYFAGPQAITIASEPDYPPYCLVDEDGNAVGFSVDLFKAAAEAAGLSVTIEIGIWSLIKQELADGKIDALPLVGRTPEREEIFDFTMPYLSLHGAVFVRKGDNSIHSLEDLKDKKIVVMKGDNAEEFVRREKISERIFTTQTFEEAFQELAEGKYDAVITQRVMGLELLKRAKIDSIEALDLPLPEFRQDFCFAVKKGNDKLLARLNEGLSIVIANDTYQEIRLKWFGPITKETLAFEDIFKIVLVTLIPLLIIISSISIIVLRGAVKRQTKSLNNEIAEHKRTLEVMENQQTRLKKSEQQIRLLLNSTGEGIFGIDKDGYCTFVNNAAFKTLGYADELQIIGKNIHNLIHHTGTDSSQRSIHECKIINASRAGEEAHGEDEVFWRADGVCFPVEYSVFPIRQNEESIGSVVTFGDISDRKKAAQELLQLKDELEIQVEKRTEQLQEKIQKLDKSQQAMLYMVEDLNRITAELKNERHKLRLSNQELEAFAYSVSHDLRAPLRAIDGFSQFLAEEYAEKLDDEGKRFIHIIRENTVRMDRLIADLLDLSRLSRVAMKPVLTDMRTIVESVYQESATAEEKARFETIIGEMPPVFCDVTLIKLVWGNLIGNALKYSAKSAVKRIEIGAEETAQEVIFFIRDQGAGFDDLYIHKLFGVFQRLHKEAEFNGCGVGLAIVKRIIERHTGRVWAEGTVNKGASFYFSLPCRSTIDHSHGS